MSAGRDPASSPRLWSSLLPALLLLFAGLKPREAVGAALLLACPLTLLVAISRMGVALGVIGPATASAVLLLAVGSALLFPWLYRLLIPGPPVSPPG